MNPIFNLTFLLLIAGFAATDWYVWKTTKIAERITLGALWTAVAALFLPTLLGMEPSTPLRWYIDYLSPWANKLLNTK